MEKILDIIELIAYEKGLEVEVVLNIVKEGLIKIAKEEINPDYNYFVEQDSKERTLNLYYRLKVCADSDINESNQSQCIALSTAKELGDVVIGDEVDYELRLEDMNRGAINKLFNNLEYNLQRSLEEQILQSFRAQVGKIINGQVVGFDNAENTFVEIDSIRAILPLKNRIKGEKFKIGDVVKAILKFVSINKNGLYVELSRTTPRFLEELLALEVPEINDNEVIIHKSARIPGERAKVAVYSHSARIDPIGCCVGVKGVRINAVSQELAGESIDCIEYSPNLELFIAKALTPAQVVSVKVLSTPDLAKADSTDEIESSEPAPKPRAKAIVQINSEQKSKAIGKNGVNIRLASMLCECDIELNEIGENTTQDKAQKTSGIDALASLFKS